MVNNAVFYTRSAKIVFFVLRLPNIPINAPVAKNGTRKIAQKSVGDATEIENDLHRAGPALAHGREAERGPHGVEARAGRPTHRMYKK
jgi:hypothetical protein